MAWLIRNSAMVLSRSGYSTIMDLAVFGKKALFIPTPGQTEQEYLAKYLQNKKYILSLPQSELHLLSHSIKKALQLKGLPANRSEKLNDLKKILDINQGRLAENL
jgi:UDP-N-acetylglucosamine:LPS N-acetylglucosamine transferase